MEFVSFPQSEKIKMKAFAPFKFSHDMSLKDAATVCETHMNQPVPTTDYTVLSGYLIRTDTLKYNGFLTTIEALFKQTLQQNYPAIGNLKVDAFLAKRPESSSEVVVIEASATIELDLGSVTNLNFPLVPKELEIPSSVAETIVAPEPEPVIPEPVNHVIEVKEDNSVRAALQEWSEAITQNEETALNEAMTETLTNDKIEEALSSLEDDLESSSSFVDEVYASDLSDMTEKQEEINSVTVTFDHVMSEPVTHKQDDYTVIMENPTDSSLEGTGEIQMQQIDVATKHPASATITEIPIAQAL
jgi:hypothetical protein